MNKTTKGAVAAGAAAVLLLGGAGTLAFWNAEGDIAGGSISSGSLQLTEPTGGEWTLNGDPVANIASVLIVPGDELEYTAGWTIVATGNNLEADLSITGLDASGALEPFVDVTPTFEVEGNPATEITDQNNGNSLEATVAVDFPFGAVADNASQELSLDLTGVKVALTQSDATP